MGLDISVPGSDQRVSWSYNGFRLFREAILRECAMTRLETTWYGDNDEKLEDVAVRRHELHTYDDLWEFAKNEHYGWLVIWEIDDPLLPLIMHPDNQREIAPCWCPGIASRLSAIAAKLPDDNDPMRFHEEQAQKLVQLCYEATRLNAPLRFA